VTATPDEIVAFAVEARALQRPAELADLVWEVKQLRPRTIVEIGTCHGGTVRAWCECARHDARIITVDLPGGPFGGGYTDERAGVIRTFARSKQKLSLVTGDSHTDEVRQEVWDLARGGVDFLFIDGDHSYAGVKADFEDYSPLVRPGGLIAFHDIAPYPERPDVEVERFWREEIRGRYNMREFIHPGDYLGCGIGVIEVDA
jgi:predicted O-methyltransferase YrrM